MVEELTEQEYKQLNESITDIIEQNTKMNCYWDDHIISQVNQYDDQGA